MFSKTCISGVFDYIVVLGFMIFVLHRQAGNNLQHAMPILIPWLSTLRVRWQLIQISNVNLIKYKVTQGLRALKQNYGNDNLYVLWLRRWR